MSFNAIGTLNEVIVHKQLGTVTYDIVPAHGAFRCTCVIAITSNGETYSGVATATTKKSAKNQAAAKAYDAYHSYNIDTVPQAFAPWDAPPAYSIGDPVGDSRVFATAQTQRGHVMLGPGIRATSNQIRLPHEVMRALLEETEEGRKLRRALKRHSPYFAS